MMQMGHIGLMAPQRSAPVGLGSKIGPWKVGSRARRPAERAHVFRIPLAEAEHLEVKLPIPSDLADGSAETTCQIEAAVRQRAVIPVLVWGLPTQ